MFDCYICEKYVKRETVEERQPVADALSTRDITVVSSLQPREAQINFLVAVIQYGVCLKPCYDACSWAKVSETAW
jgi:hypothetical protein